MASNLEEYDFEHSIDGSQLFFDFDEASIRLILNQLSV